MKSRIGCLFMLGIIVISLYSEVSAIPVPYKKKVEVQPFENPPGWVGTYNPGILIANLLKQKLQNQGNVIPVRFRVSQSPGKKADNKTHGSPAQIIISGQIVKYRPALPVNLESTPSEKKMSRSAEVQIEFKILQGQTRRFITGFVLNEQSKDGEFPLGYSQSSLNLASPDFRKTFMGNALSQITDRFVPVIVDYLGHVPLDGQVIGIEQKEEQMLINVGEKNGVEIRDEFIVYSVDANFPDPLYQEDLGDRLTKLGVVRVINVQEGFSEAVIMAGGDFAKGNLVRSKKTKPLPKSLKKVQRQTAALAPQ